MLTDWFPPSVNPTRAGLYITKRYRLSDCWYIMYWSGRDWYAAECANGLAQDNMSIISGYHNPSAYYWRDLTELAAIEAAKGDTK